MKILLIFNLCCWCCFQLSGISLIVLGSIVLSNISSYEDLYSNNPEIIPILMIVAGCLTFVMAFIGCFGALKKSVWMMYTVSILYTLSNWLTLKTLTVCFAVFRLSLCILRFVSRRWHHFNRQQRCFRVRSDPGIKRSYDRLPERGIHLGPTSDRCMRVTKGITNFGLLSQCLFFF